MKLSAILPAALLLVAACSDVPTTQHPRPTAPAASLAASLASAPRASARATVCLSYDGELQRKQALLVSAPDDAALQAGVRSLEGIIADVCD